MKFVSTVILALAATASAFAPAASKFFRRIIPFFSSRTV